MKTPFLLAITLTATLLASLAQAENWPRFRGPNGQGLSTETGLPTTWSATENIRWKTPITSEGWSSPIVWNDHVFITGTIENGTQCRIIALDRKTGSILWDTPTVDQVPPTKEGKNSHATPTPATDGERVYAVFGDGSMVAVNFDGTIAWTNRESKFYSRHGLGASPIVHDGLLIMPLDGSNRVAKRGDYPNNPAEERLGWQIPWDKAEVVALDVNTGKRVWTGKRGKSRIAHATPIIVDHAGQTQLVSIAGDAVQGFDPKTGERLWTIYCQGEGLVPSPVIGEDLIFTSSGFEKTTLRGIRPGGPGDGDVTATNIAWEQLKGVPTQSSLIYVKPYLYAVTDGGVATCFQPDDGSVVWQGRLDATFSASPVSSEGRIYLLSEEGETIILAAGPEFQIVARNQLGERCQASPAISQGNIFLRSDKHVFCIGS